VNGLAAWTALVLLPGVIGGLAWACAAPRAPATPRGRLRGEQAFFAYMAGFALLSAGLFVLAHVGRLTIGVTAGFVAALVASCVAVGRGRGALREARRALPSALALGAALAVASSLFATILPPIDATVAGSDSSIYLAAAHQLARTGRLTHHDGLVAGMTVEEREALFRNRFEGDHTGPHARFPGGVSLAAPAGDTVSFYFFHLFPVWLSVGLETVGPPSYLRLMSLFACLGVASLFLVGRRIGGVSLGVLACIVHASFYPQAYFSRLPTSEMLAQALFLAGLASLVCGSDGEGGADERHVHLAGWLWGTFCLCRVDALPFVALGLATMSVLPARAGLRVSDWLVPMSTTAVFACAALLHQLSTGIHYVGALPRGRLPVAIGVALAGDPWLAGAALALVAAAAALLVRGAASGPGGTRLRAAARIAGLLASATVLGVFLPRLDPDLVARHLRWIASYTTPVLLLLLGAGVVLALSLGLRGTGKRGTAVALAFFAGPALCYAVDPMVLPLQPWAMRRFVPMVFPLMLLLALAGWQAGLRRACGRRVGLAAAGFAALALGVAGTFLRSTVRLHPWGQEEHGPIDALARAIPPDALVLVPDASADLHLQLALAYAHGRDVLVLPLAGPAEAGIDEIMRLFLSRRIAGGRSVWVVLPRPTDLCGRLLRHFDVERRHEVAVSFTSVSFVGPDAFPEPPSPVTLGSRVREVQLPRAWSAALSVSVGDPVEDAAILVSGFHDPEVEVRPGRGPRRFRWTGPLARMAFTTAAAVELTIDPSRPASAGPSAVEVDVEGAPATVAPPGAGSPFLRVFLPRLDGPARKRILSVRARTFRMAELGLSPDERELGVRVVSARLEP
jgi:hypothetical protein